jgi:transcriptional regulator with XRE-family HTH domain
MTFGKNMQQARLRADMSLQDVADGLSANGKPITRQMLSYFERDKKNPSADMVCRLSEVLGVSCDYLLKGDSVILERLAELEHVQWANWTLFMLENLTDENMARWRWQAETPYVLLSEREKESDRQWARRAFDILKNV